MKPNNQLTLSYLESHPLDAARTLERLPAQISARLLEAIPSELAARLLAAMSPKAAGACLHEIPEFLGTRIQHAVPPVAMAHILKVVSPEETRTLLARLRLRDRMHIERLLYYPLDTVGAHMDAVPFTLASDLSIGEALRRVRAYPPAGNEVFVVDRAQRLVGIIDSIALIKGDGRMPLQTLVRPAPARLSVRTTLTMTRAHPAWQNHRALPVIEGDGILVGAISYRTVIEATQLISTHPPANADLIDSVLNLAQIFWTALAELLHNLSTLRASGARGGK
ncbi:MAG: magnesium transporter [Gammaproteobacteria bacterium]|nr:magnesium transporter [Gammaproteobacteria bacterium]